ncbi:hypothetical protein Pcinc_003230 [Petrolisthes cinctipes]|uniref:Uncharacterized protein n=1 Tax=Petrolisthes cinctipes TaxID=88211 RepID=A0AAE1GJQ9_PETCI|nr:hypothetical protein Pcinc_003230 [Petrolisthes cinctipes]
MLPKQTLGCFYEVGSSYKSYAARGTCVLEPAYQKPDLDPDDPGACRVRETYRKARRRELHLVWTEEGSSKPRVIFPSSIHSSLAKEVSYVSRTENEGLTNTDGVYWHLSTIFGSRRRLPEPHTKEPQTPSKVTWQWTGSQI